MYVIDGFWSAAMRMAGRIDFSTVLAAGLIPQEVSDEALVRLGVSMRQVARLRSESPVESEARPIRITDADYPAFLRPVPYAPPVLFVLGNEALLHGACAAIVGARRCSDVARRYAGELSHTVVAAGGVVVSGVAWGIDEAAHESAQGRTIGVLGQGLDVPMVGSLAGRARAILRAGGLLVSELPPGQQPEKWTFPQRNRVIAGLSRAVVVVEAGVRSGSLITARCALDLGRELFVVPDHPTQVHAAGGMALLESGIAPLSRPGQLVEAVGLTTAEVAPATGILGLLHDAPDIATLAVRTGESVRVLAQRLSALELTGQVQRLPGGRFSRSATTVRPGGFHESTLCASSGPRA